MSTLAKTFMTEEEYLAIERTSERKSEYFDGEMFEIVGARGPHNLIEINVGAELRQQLRSRPCRVYSSQQRVRTPTGLNTYPDLTVVCADSQFADAHEYTLLNPILIVEVLSPSTKDYDHGTKFEHYRAIESLRAYLMISSERIKAELFTWQPGGLWTLAETTRLEDSVELECIGCRLQLTDLYEKVVLA